MTLRAFSFLLTLFLFCTIASAELSVKRANELYERGQYGEAVVEYQKIVDAGVKHENVFYNLGNSQFRMGQMGPAIFNYERAIKMDPAMEDAAYNAAIAREAVKEQVIDRIDGSEETGGWREWIKTISAPGVQLGLLALSFLVFGFLIALRFLNTGFLRTAMVVINSFLIIGLIVFAILLCGYVYYTDHAVEGIVLPDRTQLREGPAKESVARVELHPGLKVRIVGSQGGWKRVRLSNGVEGWVSSSAIGAL